MKNLFITALLIQIFISVKIKCCAQVTYCIATIEAVPLDPQSGQYNYFSVKITLNQTYDQDVTVKGHVYNQGEPNTNNPFTLTVSAGNLSSETSNTFFQTGAANTAAVSVDALFPFYVSKENIIYCVEDACVSFSEEFGDIANVYLDSLNEAEDYLDSFIELDESEYDSFINSIDLYGIASTSVAFNVDSNNIHAYFLKRSAAFDKLIELATYKYGELDSLTKPQLSDLQEAITHNILYNRFAPLSIGDLELQQNCHRDYSTCNVNAWLSWHSGIDNCILGGLGITFGNPYLGLGVGIACLIRNDRRYNIAKKLCEDNYDACLNNN